MPNLAVLVSGTGTILEAMVRRGLPISLVVADRKCRGLAIAGDAGIETRLIDRREFGYKPRADWDRSGFTAAVTQALAESHIDLIAMAGFMTILAPSIFDRYQNRILNTHPSLLPRFKGAHAVHLALEAGVPETGCTVHIATAELDSGRILAQATVPVLPGDTPDTLQERIKTVERALYPKTILEYANALYPSGSRHKGIIAG